MTGRDPSPMSVNRVREKRSSGRSWWEARFVDTLWAIRDVRGVSVAVRRRAWVFACIAGLLGTLHAAVSAYWGAGGTALLDTVGGTLEREGRAGAVGVLAVVWASVVLKLAASGIGLLAVAQPRWLSPPRCQLMRRAAWLAAVVLVLYGGVLTLIGLLVQADVVRASAHADHTAQRWHAFLWDPWFFVWGLMLAVALVLSRRADANRVLHPCEPEPARA